MHMSQCVYVRVCTCALTYGGDGSSQEELPSEGSAVPPHVLEVFLAEVDRSSEASRDCSQDVSVLQTDLVLVVRQESLAVVHVTVGRRQPPTWGEEFSSEGY